MSSLLLSLNIYGIHEDDSPLKDRPECSICMEKKVGRILPCLHKLCTTCCQKISESSSLCPFCRNEFSKDNVVDFKGPQRLILPKLQRSAVRSLETSYEVRNPHRLHPLKRKEDLVDQYFSDIRHGHTKAVKVMTSVFDVKYQDGYGNSALHVAAQNNKKTIVKLLLSKGADINLQNKMGNTPLHFASAYQHHGVVQYLVENGARVDVKNYKGKFCLEGIR